MIVAHLSAQSTKTGTKTSIQNLTLRLLGRRDPLRLGGSGATGLCIQKNTNKTRHKTTWILNSLTEREWPICLLNAAANMHVYIYMHIDM